MGVAAGFAIFGAALGLATPSTPACTPTHRCHHVFHLGTSSSPTRHVSWDSRQLFPVGPLAINLNYSPHLPNDGFLRTDPIGECGLHYVLPARFTGVATRCGDGRRPVHFQFANVSPKHLRIGVTYWVPEPLFTG